MSSVSQELAIFQPTSIERAVDTCDWINFRPVGLISKGSAIEFQIPGTSSEYILLSKTRLYVKVRILKGDGSPVNADNDVSISNLCLHSLFRQVDVSLQQQIVTSTVGVNYSYKSILDVLLNYGHDLKNSLLQGEGFYKDQAGYMNNENGNSGHFLRKSLTANGFADFEGVLHVDIAQQDRAIINGVQIGVTLFQSDDNFRLFTTDGEQYQIEIADAVLKVCHIKVNPSVLLSHNERLKKSPAVYPYWQSNVKSFNIGSGTFNFSVDDIFHGVVPDKLIVAFTASAAYSGDYTKNPFNFHHYFLNYLELAVNGRSVPHIAFHPQYEEVTDASTGITTTLDTGYVSEYLSLFKNQYPQNDANHITRSDYKGGYAIYVFDLKPGTTDKLYSQLVRGHTRLSVRFGRALTEPVNAIVYGTFPSEFRIDQTRNVLL